MEQYEVVKEYHYDFDNVEPRIKGRISRIIRGANAQYTWDINYFCRLENEGDVYVPSAPFGNSLEEIEHKLDQYVKRFINAVDWRENTYY
jgi:hypothetical protein